MFKVTNLTALVTAPNQGSIAPNASIVVSSIDYAFILASQEGILEITDLGTSGALTVSPLTNAEIRAQALMTTDTKNGTRVYDWANNIRTPVTSSSSATIALPPLYTNREVMVHSEERCAIRYGSSGVAAADVTATSGHLILEAGERFHHRLEIAVTHFRVVRDTTDGSLTITAVVN